MQPPGLGAGQVRAAHWSTFSLAPGDGGTPADKVSLQFAVIQGGITLDPDNSLHAPALPAMLPCSPLCGRFPHVLVCDDRGHFQDYTGHLFCRMSLTWFLPLKQPALHWFEHNHRDTCHSHCILSQAHVV